MLASYAGVRLADTNRDYLRLSDSRQARAGATAWLWGMLFMYNVDRMYIMNACGFWNVNTSRFERLERICYAMIPHTQLSDECN